MFDQETVQLINSAPPLDGLDLADLPRRLTDAFATIVSTRIRLREAVVSAPDADLAPILSEMRRLAFTHEALVSALADRDNRAGAAFVAGSAHQVRLLAQRLHEPDGFSSLSYQSISPEVSATLLFLIAEATADAAETAKAIQPPPGDTIETLLLKSIAHLAAGQMAAIVNLPSVERSAILGEEPTEQAVQALHDLTYRGVKQLASEILQAAPDGSETALSIFERVKALSVSTIYEIDYATPAFSIFPGPYHLASLLSSVAKDLPPAAVMNVVPPGGLADDGWKRMLRRIARQRPFLWRNHRQAVDAGYLEPGTSAAISFPTGAGKSTLSELKIAAALLSKTKVLFLAPTLALVDQTARSLSDTFPSADVEREHADDFLLGMLAADELPAISVMTPERCLAMFSLKPSIFAEIGLLVFDECHLLHAPDPEHSRRAIDAMLCVLNIIRTVPNVDLLFLSAMMSNCDEIAGWLGDITGRRCLPLSIRWKPTRQVRGCVVYDEGDIRKLNAVLLTERRANRKAQHPPAALKRSLTVRPFGFFCLHQTWQSTQRDDYALRPLLDSTVTLATGRGGNGQWYLTPNGNKVAAALASAAGKKNLKTLIFTQTIPLANSAVDAVCTDLGEVSYQLTQDEQDLYASSVDEVGSAEGLYIAVTDGKLTSAAACHHGLLLPTERRLHESLFKRIDGINVLVATSTLAQGMNLPSEVVIISGDRRFDSDANRMEKLEAHELLNAAGRAGRAGQAANGFVLVVPSKVVHFNNQNSRIHSHWSDLQAIFSQSDQCLAIEDPLAAILDRIHDATTDPTPLTQYFLQRLPPAEGFFIEDPDTFARDMLNRSFAAYRSRQQGAQAWVESRIAAALQARRSDPAVPKTLTWVDYVASAAGVPVSSVEEVGHFLDSVALPDGSLLDWYTALSKWIRQRPKLMSDLLKPQNLEGLFGTPFKKLVTQEDQARYAADRIFPLLDRWIGGQTLVEIERAFGTDEKRIGRCDTARQFALRIVPDLAYLFGLPALVARARSENGDSQGPSLALEMLANSIRQGVDRVEKLAIYSHHKRQLGRRAVHREFDRINPYLPPAGTSEAFSDVRERVKTAVETADLFT